MAETQTRIQNPNGPKLAGESQQLNSYLMAADFFLKRKNFESCRKNAFRAQALDPIHTGPAQLLAIAAVISAATETQPPDYYSILGIPRFTGDLDLINSRVEKLIAVLNPRENRYSLAEEAHRLVAEAWSVLSVPAHRARFDERLKAKLGIGIRSFWTVCPYCYYVYEFPEIYKDFGLRCVNEKCRRAFHGVEIQPPPPQVAAEGKYFCPGFMPMKVENGGGNGIDSWTPFLPVGSNQGSFTANRAGNEKQSNGVNRAGEAQKVEMNEHCGDRKMETDNGGSVGMKKQSNGVNRAGKAQKVEINKHCGDQKMETDNGGSVGMKKQSNSVNREGEARKVEINEHCGDQRMGTDNGGSVGMKKRKMAAKSTKKLMGKGVRVEGIDIVLEESSAEGKSRTEGNKDDGGSGNTCDGVESELMRGKLDLFEEGDEIFVSFQLDSD